MALTSSLSKESLIWFLVSASFLSTYGWARQTMQERAAVCGNEHSREGLQDSTDLR